MEYPFGIVNYPDLPLKLRTMIMKEWSRTQNAKPVGRPSKYPWSEWMNGRIHSALAGKDFHQSVLQFRQMIRQKGYHSGMSVKSWTWTKEESGPTGPTQFWVGFQFTPKDPDWPGVDVTDDPVED